MLTMRINAQNAMQDRLMQQAASMGNPEALRRMQELHEQSDNTGVKNRKTGTRPKKQKTHDNQERKAHPMR